MGNATAMLASLSQRLRTHQHHLPLTTHPLNFPVPSISTTTMSRTKTARRRIGKHFSARSRQLGNVARSLHSFYKIINSSLLSIVTRHTWQLPLSTCCIFNRSPGEVFYSRGAPSAGVHHSASQPVRQSKPGFCTSRLSSDRQWKAKSLLEG